VACWRMPSPSRLASIRSVGSIRPTNSYGFTALGLRSSISALGGLTMEEMRDALAELFQFAPFFGVPLLPTVIGIGSVIYVATTMYELLSRANRYQSIELPMRIETRAAPVEQQVADDQGVLERIKQAAGLLLYQVPNKMVLRKYSRVEVRIGGMSYLAAEQSAILKGWEGEETPMNVTIPVVERMSVRLHGNPEDFDFRSASPVTQYIGRAPMAAAQFNERDYGRWVFQVKPLRLGKRTLYVTVAGVIGGGPDGGASRELEPREFPVTVRIGLGTIFSFAALWVWALLCVLFAAVVGLVLQDFWWPQAKRALGLEARPSSESTQVEGERPRDAP
jgi:hypothetical protein